MRKELSRIELVEECDDKLLNRREKLWIRSFDCLYPNGYNITPGGKQTRRQNAFWAKRARNI